MKRIMFGFVLVWLSARVWALEPFVVSDIRVDGLQRISPGTVFNYMPVKVGDRINEELARESIRALFKTGFFKDVKLEQEGTVLVVKVEERPSISKIEFIGHKSIEDEELKKGMQQIGFVEGRVFNPQVLEQVTEELKKLYFARGKYGAEIKSTVTPQERNRVSITIEVIEGDTAKIKQINIVGNNAFPDSTLLGRFELSTPTVFSFISKRDRYSKQKLQADLETLRSFYQDQGYLDFNIESTQVTISPDKKDIFVTINVTEGERYTVSTFAIKGKLTVPEAELLKLVTIEPGATYSRREVSNSRKAIADRLAEDGYAFATVNAVPDIDKEQRKVSFTLFVDPGRRVYVRRINISGNTVTRDEVIRREFRQLEGAYFSPQKIQRSRVRLQRLGFFEDIKVETPAVAGSPDQVDVNVAVTERPTGSLLFGVGYSDADGILLQASIQQRNLFGTGRELQLSVDTSAVTDVIQLRYDNPYWTIDGVGRGFTVFRRTTDAQEAGTAEYLVDTLGGSINFRIPVTEINSVAFGVGYERVDLETTTESPPEITDFIEQYPSNNLYQFTGGFSYDTRDSILYPTRGVLHRITWETALPGSDLEYYKASYGATLYLPISRVIVLRAFGELGYGAGYGNTDELPFFKNYYAGGAQTVRGYRPRSLGPRDSGPTPEPLGGDRRILGNLELLFPVPGSTSQDKRFSIFLDAGQVYGPGESLDLNEVRLGGGVAFNWFSPLGPLSVSYGIALNKKEGDETERFQITLGRFFQ